MSQPNSQPQLPPLPLSPPTDWNFPSQDTLIEIPPPPSSPKRSNTLSNLIQEVKEIKDTLAIVSLAAASNVTISPSKAHNKRRAIADIPEKEKWFCPNCDKEFTRRSLASINLHKIQCTAKENEEKENGKNERIRNK
jgi:hypothetical protein